MIIMVCEGHVVTDKVFCDRYDKTPEQLEQLKELGRKEKQFKYDIFIFHLMGYINNKKKRTRKVVENPIFIPDVKSEGRKRKYFITCIKLDKNIPPKNSFKTYYTIYGEQMVWDDLRDRVGLYDSFMRNNKLHKARSFKINGIEITVERKPKNSVRYTVENTISKEILTGLYRRDVLAITGCRFTKFANMATFNRTATHQNFIITREL